MSPMSQGTVALVGNFITDNLPCHLYHIYGARNYGGHGLCFYDSGRRFNAILSLEEKKGHELL